jgi:maltose/moltooligosaccharide transporter
LNTINEFGRAWACILSLPYTQPSESVPPERTDFYVGVYNSFIVIPQLVAASVLDAVLKLVFGGARIYAWAIGGVSFVLSGRSRCECQHPRQGSGSESRRRMFLV